MSRSLMTAAAVLIAGICSAQAQTFKVEKYDIKGDGGTDYIAFLLGNSAGAPDVANANATEMSATFWIETVEYSFEVPIFQPGQPPLRPGT